MSQVFRVERTKNYTVMANYHLKDKQLSLKAKHFDEIRQQLFIFNDQYLHINHPFRRFASTEISMKALHLITRSRGMIR